MWQGDKRQGDCATVEHGDRIGDADDVLRAEIELCADVDELVVSEHIRHHIPILVGDAVLSLKLLLRDEPFPKQKDLAQRPLTQ